MPKKSTKAKTKDTKARKSFEIGRTPIVAVMGHVDHGKTSLLDTIRGTNVTATEAGGITQNTRAHQIEFMDQKITFIDTPGHEAFTEMRSRGAKVTDIVLLVVAADDGVQPQTKESIKFALDEKVPVVVAINKIDLPGLNLNKLKQQLSTAGLQLEEYGGDVIVVEVSAIKKIGIENLLETLLLVSEMQGLKEAELKEASASAFVLESKLDKNLGPVAMVLVKAGKLNEGDFVVTEKDHFKIRTLLADNQQKVTTAYEGDPVWIIGLKDVLRTGEFVNVFTSEKAAKEFSRNIEKGEAKLEGQEPEAIPEQENDLELLASLLTQAQAKTEIKYLNVVLKTDTQGTLEVAAKELNDLSDDEVQIKILNSGTGPITEKDIITAKNGYGIVIGFQVDLPRQVSEIARKERVLVRNYKVIYEMIDEVAEALDSLAEPTVEQIEVARAKVKQVFVLSNKQVVAGTEVIKGNITKGYRAFIKRDGVNMHEGKITSLKHLKQEVKEVRKGLECGILIEPQFDIQEGDEIVAFKLEKV